MPAAKEPKVTRRKVSDYLPDMQNANLGSERGLQMVEDSIREDGVGRSIVADKNGKIPAGNKTLEAAVNAGITDVIEVETDGYELIVHKRRNWDLDDPQGSARRYAYRDNRASEVSLAWDANRIAADVAAGVKLDTMFYDWELDTLAGNVVENSDPRALWQGMPEFEQEDLTAFQSIHIHFRTIEDLQAFAELIGQPLTDKTRAIWYPKAEIASYADKRYSDEP